MSRKPAWEKHFEKYDDFQVALNNICDKITILEGAQYVDNKHPSRGAFSRLLLDHGEGVVIQAYGATQDAVHGPDPVTCVSSLFTTIIYRIANEQTKRHP